MSLNKNIIQIAPVKDLSVMCHVENGENTNIYQVIGIALVNYENKYNKSIKGQMLEYMISTETGDIKLISDIEGNKKIVRGF